MKTKVIGLVQLVILLWMVTIQTFTQAQGTWVQKNDVGSNAMNGPSPRYGAVSFSIGNKGYMGTGYAITLLRDFWEYDPVSDAWTQKADVAGEERIHAVGFSIGNKGYIGGGAYNLYEFGLKDFWEYDPEANSWTQRADLEGGSIIRGVAFAIAGKGYAGENSWWEYDPVADQWNPRADLPAGGYGAAGFSIGNKGYLGTGFNGKEFWEYDPATDSWLQKADFGGDPRDGAVGFSIGSKGYIGTGADSWYYTNPRKDIWEYDPTADSWQQKADLAGDARTFAFGFGIGNKGYIGSGSQFDDDYYSDNYLPDFLEFNPDSNTWVARANFGASPRVGAVGFNIGNKGFISTGSQSTGDYSGSFIDSWEFNPDSAGWSRLANFAGSVRESATGFSIGNKGYIATGIVQQYYPEPINDLWEYDASANTWTQKADFPPGPRYSAVGFSIGSKGYIGTGYSGFPDYHKDFWEYDPSSNTWMQKSDFGGTPRSGSVGFTIGEKGYIGTGFSNIGGSQYFKDFWEYDPALDIWTNKADFGGLERAGAVAFSIGNKGYIGTGNNNGFPNDFWEYDPASDSWSQMADFDGLGRNDAIAFSANGKGYVGTGQNYGTELKDFWEFTPPIVEPVCNTSSMLTTGNVTSTTAKLKWNGINEAIYYKVSYKITGTSEWITAKSIDNIKKLHQLTSGTQYVWKVKSICATQPVVASDWSEKLFFTTSTLRLADEFETTTLEVYPNPLSNSATISFSLSEDSHTSIELFDVAGRKLQTILNQNLLAGNQEVTIQRGQLIAGIYLLKVKMGDRLEVKKLVVE